MKPKHPTARNVPVRDHTYLATKFGMGGRVGRVRFVSIWVAILTLSTLTTYAQKTNPQRVESITGETTTEEVTEMPGPHVWIKNVPAPWEAASFDTNLPPGTGERVIFNERGRGDVISGLNQATIDLRMLEVQEGNDSNFGADGNPLIISADEVLFNGQGTMFYKDGNGVTDLMVVDSSNLQDAVKLSGDSVTRLRVRRGKVDVLANYTGTITDVEVAPYGGSGSAIVKAASGSNLQITNLLMTGGEVTGDINLGLSTVLVVNGGYFSTTLGQSAITAILYMGGGLLEWLPSRASVAVTPQWTGKVHLIGGTFDCRNDNPKTMSDVRVWDSAVILYGASDTITLARMKY